MKIVVGIRIIMIITGIYTNQYYYNYMTICKIYIVNTILYIIYYSLVAMYRKTK